MGTKILSGGELGVNTAIRYGGNKNNYIVNPSFMSDTSGSFSLWFRWIESGNNGNGIWPILQLYRDSNGPDSISTSFYLFYRRNNNFSPPNRRRFGWDISGSILNVAIIDIAPSIWYHLGVSSNKYLVVNGSVISSISNTWFPNITGTGDLTMRVGNTSSDSFVKSYDIKGLMYFNTGLSDTDFNEIYNKGISFDPRKSKWADNLISFWPLEENGATLNDIVGSNNLTGSTGGPIWANY